MPAWANALIILAALVTVLNGLGIYWQWFSRRHPMKWLTSVGELPKTRDKVDAAITAISTMSDAHTVQVDLNQSQQQINKTQSDFNVQIQSAIEILGDGLQSMYTSLKQDDANPTILRLLSVVEQQQEEIMQMKAEIAQMKPEVATLSKWVRAWRSGTAEALWKRMRGIPDE